MLKDLSNKNRLIFLLVGVALILVLGYKMSIQKTIDLYNENKNLSGINAKSDSQIIREIAQRTQIKKQIDSVLTVLNQDGSSTELINMLFDQADKNNLGIIGLEESKTNQQTAAVSYNVKVSGAYVNLVKYLRSVESKIYSAQIESVNIYSEIDRKTKEENLYMEVILSKTSHGS